MSAPVLLAPLPPLNTRDLLSGYPLALPAWLMEGHLYPYLGETPYGWVYWAPIRLLWPSGSVVRAQWPWAYGLSPTLLLSLCAAGLSLYLIRRGRTVLWLPLAWALAWAMIAYPLFQPNPAGVSPYIRTILSLAGAVGLAPALALLLAAPVGARERVIRWIGVLVVAVMLLPSGYSLIQEMRLVADAERARQAFVEPPLDSVIPTQPYLSPDGQLARTPSLRDMASVARALRGTAARLERLEFVQPYSWVYEYVMPHAWALDSIYAAHRAMPAGAVPLPLERETAYLVASGHVPFHPPSVELQRPASSMIVFTPDGADTGARVVTLRPRGVADWTAGATPVSDGRFNDGSRLVAASRVSAVNGSHGLHLYWELPAAADGRSVGESVLVLAETPAPGGLTPRGQKLPPVALRRGGELIAFRASMPPESRSGTAASPRLVVRLLDAAGNPIRRPDGSTQLVLPIN